MIRILHVVFSLEPGGMENGLVNVMNRLPADQFEVDVCCLERRGHFADRLPKSAKVHVLNKKPGRSIGTIWRLFRLLRQVRPHVLHTHDLGPLIYGSWASFGGWYGQILHGEHCQLSPDETTPKRLQQRRFYYQFCRRIHTVSESLKTHVLEMDLGRDDVLCVTNGVDTERFVPGNRAEARSALGLPPDATVLGVVARFAAHKRQTAVLSAFERLGSEDPKLHLLLVGDGPERPRILEQVERHPHRERILVPGFSPTPEKLYQALDLLIIPSLLEGLSNAMLEAMACGVPSLSHQACGSAEAIEPGVNGLIADLSTDEDLHDQVVQALATPEQLRDMGDRARITASERFSLDTMATGYMELYRQCAGEEG